MTTPEPPVSPRNCDIQAADGCITIEGWPRGICAGFSEADAQALADQGDLKKLDGVVAPSSVYESARPLILHGRRIGLWLGFRSGVLNGVSINEAGLSFWEESTHHANVALLKAIFGSKGRHSRWTSTVKFRGGEALARFERNVGALTDGGASLSFRYLRTAVG